MGAAIRGLALLAIFLIGISSYVHAGQIRGTAEEAKTMVARAIAAYDQKGEAVFAEITAPSTTFVYRDLHVIAIGADHIVRAHGADASRVGLDISTLVDVDGYAYGKAISAEATEQGAWVDYKRKDPVSGQVLPKSSWMVLHDGYIFVCGIYKD